MITIIISPGSLQQTGNLRSGRPEELRGGADGEERTCAGSQVPDS